MPPPLRSCFGRKPRSLKSRRASADYLAAVYKEFAQLRAWVYLDVGPPTSPDQFDPKCEKYIQYVYDSAPSPAQLPRFLERCKQAILGIQLVHRNLRGLLPETWESLKTLALGMPISVRVHIPLEVSMALVLYAFGQGILCDTQRAHYWHPFAFGTMFMSEFLARPGEYFAARFSDLQVFPPSLVFSHWRSVISFSSPKARKHFGKRQAGLTHDEGFCR